MAGYKNVSSDLENVGQGHHLQKSLYLNYIWGRFLPNFQRNYGSVNGNKCVTSADLENVGQRHCLQKSLYLGSYTTNSNQTFIKMMQWAWQEKRHIS